MIFVKFHVAAGFTPALLPTLALLLAGCGGLVANQAYKDLSPEQIKAVKESGATLTGCLSVGGPPVGGRTSLLVIPRTAVARVRFTPDCQIQGADFYFPGVDEKDAEKKPEDEAPKPGA
jgi:hypothetical protein